jgi:spore coat protein CotH
MEKKERIVFKCLFVFIVLLAIFLVSAYDKIAGLAKSPEPFIKNRVVTVRLVMPEKNWKEILSNPMAKQYVRAEFWFDGKRYPNVAVRTKGNSSLMSVARSGTPRLSFKVDFNFFNSAQTFRGLKKLALNNGFSDPTFMREILGYEIFEKMGFPTPRAAFVDLWANDIHLGLYTQVETIDKTFLVRHFSNPNGNLYKPEIGAAELNWTKADVEKQNKNASNSSQQVKKDNLAINIGGARLNDLLKLMERENSSGDSNQVAGNANDFAGPFPGGPGGGFPGRQGEGFPEGPGGPGGDFPGGFGGPPEQFPQDANGAARADRPFGRGGRQFQRGFDGPPGQFQQDANGLARGDRPFGPGGGRFQGGFGGPGRGGFPGGRGPFGRGGNLLETIGLKTNENYQDYTALFRFLDVLNNCPDKSFPTEIEKVLDVDQTLRYLAVSVLIVHLDNYIGMGHNYYLYEADGKFTILPWDLNMVFGTFNMGSFQGDAANYYIDEPATLTGRPLAVRLLAYKPYLDKYHQYLRQMLSGCFAEGVIESRIDELVSMIRPYVKADELKFFTMDNFEKGLTEGNSGGMRGPCGMGFRPNMGRTPESQPPSGMEPPSDQRAVQDANSPRRFPGFGQRGPGGPGMDAPGLKSFLSKRRVSVRKQLDGELPSKSNAQSTPPGQEMNQRRTMMPGPEGQI